MSAGKVICLVGDLGTGKTSFVRDMVGNSKKDISVYLRIIADMKIRNAKCYTNFVEFIKKANSSTNKVFIIDEAYTCLPKNLRVKPDKPMSIDNQIADVLVNCRKLNNFVFIIFHSLSQVPSEWLIPYLDYFIRFRTNDQLQYQKLRFSSFPEIINSLDRLPVVPDYKPDIIKIR